MSTERTRDLLPLLVFPPFAYCALFLLISGQFAWLSYLFLIVYPAAAVMVFTVATYLLPALRESASTPWIESARLATVLVALTSALRIAAFGPRFSTFDFPFGSGVIKDFGNLWIQPLFVVGVWLVQVAFGRLWLARNP